MSDLDNICNSISLDLDNGSPIDNSKFTLAHYNINSITCENKIEELIEYFSILNKSVLIITESRLDETVSTNRLLIPGYHEPVRRDRLVKGKTTKSGGCLIYINEHLTFEQKHNMEEDLFEHIWVDIKINRIKLSINCLYRPPKHSSEDHQNFLRTSENILQKLETYQTDYKILASDLNYGNIYCQHPVLKHKPLDSTAPDLFSSYGYKQLIDIPTQITLDTISLIDLIYIQNDDIVLCHGILPKIADHSGTFMSLDIKREPNKTKTKIVYDYHNIDIDGLTNYVKNYDFVSNVFSSNLEDQTSLYSKFLTDAFEKFVPSKTVQIRVNAPPWCNAYTRLLMRKKNRNYNFFVKCTQNYEKARLSNNISNETMTQFKKQKEKANKNYKVASKESLNAHRRVKNCYYNNVNNIMNNYAISAKKKFNILTKLLNNQKYSSIPNLIENGQTITDTKQKCDILNEHFSSKSTVQSPLDPVPNLEPINVNQNFNSINTSPIEVARIIRLTKKSNISHCGISGKFLNLISTPLSFSLSNLFNNLFEKGIYPDEWKLSHITSIFKKVGLKSEKSNYRPISLLPTLSKICESVIHHRLLKHCEENKIISEKQAAYLKGDSTVNQLITMVHKIRQSWTKSQITQSVYLDISSVLDKVWHEELCAKLKQIGINGKVLELFKSFAEIHLENIVKIHLENFEEIHLKFCENPFGKF